MANSYPSQIDVVGEEAIKTAVFNLLRGDLSNEEVYRLVFEIANAKQSIQHRLSEKLQELTDHQSNLGATQVKIKELQQHQLYIQQAINTTSQEIQHFRDECARIELVQTEKHNTLVANLLGAR